MDAIKSAIEAVGSTAELARRLGVVAMTVTQWKRRGQIPAERCLEVEAATGISRYVLRPDVYGPAPDLAGRDRDGRTVAFGAGLNESEIGKAVALGSS